VYNANVPNQRSEKQKVVAVWMDEAFLAALDAARKLDHLDRSTFIRRAIAEALERRGIPCDPKHIYPADRNQPEPTAKPERSKIKFPPHRPSHYELNEGEK